jgi:iron(III) transport system permease protein
MRWQHAVFFTVIALLSLTPVAFLVLGAFWSSGPAQPGFLTPRNFETAFTQPGTAQSIMNTLEFAAGSALVGTVLGTLLAFVVARTDARFGKMVGYSVVLLVVLPYFVEDMAWTYLANPTNGILNIFIGRITGGVPSVFDVYSMGGMIAVMGLNLSSLSYLLVYTSFRNMDSSLEEVSRISGGGPFTTFRRVSIPLVRPAILAAYFLCFIVASEAFDIAAIIGAPAGIQLLPYAIYGATYQTPPNYPLANAYSLLLLPLTAVAFLLYIRSVRSAERYSVLGGRRQNQTRISLGRYRKPVSALLLLYFFAYPLLIIAMLFFVSLHTFWNPYALKGLTLQNYVDFAYYPSLSEGAVNSVIVSIVTVAITILSAFALSYVQARFRSGWSSTIQFITSIPLVIPTIVIGVSVLWALLYLPFGLYGTVWGLVIAYFIRYLPIASRFLSGPALQIGKELEEISRICGATALSTLKNVVAPLMKPALIITGLYVFLTTIKDLGVAVMLVGQNSMVISYSIYTIWLSGHYLESAAAGVTLVASVLIGLIVVSKFTRISIFSVVQPGRTGTAGIRYDSSAVLEHRPMARVKMLDEDEQVITPFEDVAI